MCHFSHFAPFRPILLEGCNETPFLLLSGASSTMMGWFTCVIGPCQFVVGVAHGSMVSEGAGTTNTP